MAESCVVICFTQLCITALFEHTHFTR